jgi:ankyrin repeat protein
MEKNDSNTKDSSRETLNDRKEMRKIINEIMSNVRKYKRNDTDVLKDKIKQLLTNSKKDVTTIKDEEKNTLAHLAVKEDKIEIVSLIINAYIDLLNYSQKFFDWFLSENSEKETVLELCSSKGNIEIIKFIYSIISKTTEDKFRLEEKKNNIFHYAAMNNQCYPIIFFFEKLQNYFKQQLIIDLPNQYGITPLHYACFYGSKEVMDLLLDLGVNINAKDQDGNTCLHFAVKSKNVRVIKKLLVRGGDKKITNNEGKLAIDLASENNDIEMVETLKTITLCDKLLYKNEIKAIKGNSNNLLLLFTIILLMLGSIIYIMRMNYLTLGKIRRDFVPFIPEITQLKLRNLICKDMYGNNITENCFTNASSYEIEQILNKTITKNISVASLFEKNNKPLFDINEEYSIHIIITLFLIFDGSVVYFLVSFLCFDKRVFLKRNNKKKVPSLTQLYEISENNPVCVKCRSIIDSTTVHCVVCNACVPNFDHHCFWLNTCISSKSLPQFKQFLFFLILCLLFNIIAFSISKI